MIEDHQFSVRIEPHPSRPGQFLWSLLKSDHVSDHSEMSFATKREAAADAAKALDRRIAAWRAGK
jgi:hypothetical protein